MNALVSRLSSLLFPPCLNRMHAATAVLLLVWALCSNTEADTQPAATAARTTNAETAEPAEPPAPVVTGTVVDADTGRPIEKFKITEGRRGDPTVKFNWSGMPLMMFSNGIFSLHLVKETYAPQFYAPVAILVESEGYLPQSFGPLRAPGTNLAIALKPGSGPSGTILEPDGQPLKNAPVYLTDVKSGVYIDGPAEVREDVSKARRTWTDGKGHFSFPPKIDDYSVVVVDDSGFAQVSAEDARKSPEIRLQKWARVEGTLMIGGRPGTNETVWIGAAQIPYQYYPRLFPTISLWLKRTTDNAGHFAFDYVPPVDVELWHSPKIGSQPWGVGAQSRMLRLSVAPGSARQVVLGGRGRPVTGRIVVKEYEKRINWREADIQFMDSVVPEPAGMPTWQEICKQSWDSLRAAKGTEARLAALDKFEYQRDLYYAKLGAFAATKAGHDYYLAETRNALNVSDDGSFRAEDIPGGKYRVTINVHGPASNKPPYRESTVVRATKDIEVPDSPGGRSDEPYDVGIIEVKADPIP